VQAAFHMEDDKHAQLLDIATMKEVSHKAVAEFIDPWLGDKVNSGYMAGGKVRQPYAGVDFIP
jgi:hypothetical protein